MNLNTVESIRHRLAVLGSGFPHVYRYFVKGVVYSVCTTCVHINGWMSVAASCRRALPLCRSVVSSKRDCFTKIKSS